MGDGSSQKFAVYLRNLLLQSKSIVKFQINHFKNGRNFKHVEISDIDLLIKAAGVLIFIDADFQVGTKIFDCIDENEEIEPKKFSFCNVIIRGFIWN